MTKQIRLFVLTLTLIVVAILILTPASLSIQAQSPPTPKIEAIINLGVLAGNTSTPTHLALDAATQKLYILGQGVPILKQGNGLAVYDIKTGEITGHININQGDNQALDLEVDAESGLIYALWNAQFSDTRPTLSVINSQPLRVEQEIPQIEAIATGNGLLYAANAEELLSVNLANNSLDQAQRITLSPAAVTGPMAVSPATNRLYLARNTNGRWSLDIFEANTLTPLNSYPSDTEILNILPMPATGEVLLVATLNSSRALYRLTTDGNLADLPYELGPRFGAAGIALSQDEERLYYSNGETRPSTPSPGDTTGPALVGIAATSDLTPLQSIPLPNNVDALAVNDATDQAFALYPFDHHLYVADLKDETVEVENTAINLKDVLVDAESNQLYVSDSANRVRRLDADSLEVLAETQLQGNTADYGFRNSTWGGELSLDRGRNRLYVSSRPAVVLAADTLAEIGLIEPGGQLAPNPNGDIIYLSDCGLTLINADTLTGDIVVPGSASQPDGFPPNPCVTYSKMDVQNRLLYSLAFNGVPGSNGGNYLYVYNTSLEPTLIYSDTGISTSHVEPANGLAFTGYARHSHKRVRRLDAEASPAGYSHHLLGVLGDMRYNPVANHLYLSDAAVDRLLTLDADTLAVLDALPLPANYAYRLAAFNPVTQRLYLIGYDGQLLVAAAGDDTTAADVPPPPAREPTGKIASLHTLSNGAILARIEAQYTTATDTRLYRTTNEGRTWLDLSQNHPALPVQALAVSENDDDSQTLFAGLLSFGQNGGLYKSVDSGETWAPAMAGLQDMWVENLYISPDFTESGLIFAKTTYGGLHQSTDGGQSWTPLLPLDPNAQFPESSTNAAAAFDGQEIILAAQAMDEMTGIYRTTRQTNNTLAPWEQVLDQPVSQLAFSPTGDIALAFGSGLWRSADGGQNWEAGGAGLIGVENLQPGPILFSPNFSRDQTAYFFFRDSSGSSPARLFRSTDTGQTWQPWLDPVSGGNSFTAITLTPDGDFILGDAATQLTRLASSSLIWADAAAIATPFPIHDLAPSPNYETDQTLFALSSEYGLFKTTNGGKGWQLTTFPARDYRVISPNPYQLAVSPNYAADETLFVATGRSLHRSTDGGERWEQLTGPPSGSFNARRVALSPNFGRDNTVLVSTDNVVYRSTNGGDTWQSVLAPEQEAANPDILTFAPNGNTVYARLGYGSVLFVSEDAGQTWQPQPSLSGDEYMSVLDNAATADAVLTGVQEFNKSLVQTGPQIPPWRIINESLPVELNSLNTVTYQADDALIIGGQGGIFKSTDNGQSWQSLSANLPVDANVTRLRAANTHLFAALATGQIYTSDSNGSAWADRSIVK